MGRRRKKYKRIIKRVRRIPSVFQCPHCGSRSLTIEFKKQEELPNVKQAVIRCGACGLRAEMTVPEIYETVDVYGKFIDAYTEGTISIEFVKTSEEKSTGAETMELGGEVESS